MYDICIGWPNEAVQTDRRNLKKSDLLITSAKVIQAFDTLDI